MKALWLALNCILCLTNWQGHAETMTFRSPYDTFNLNLQGKKGTVGGKSANLTTLSGLLHLFSNPITNECGKLSGPPLITFKKQGQTRFIYPQKGIISDGKYCLNVAGDGLYYLPIHRDFLIGTQQGHIEVGTTLRLFRQDKKVLSIKKLADSWQNEMPGKLPNWTFVESLIKSLDQYDIRLRVQTAIAAGKAKVVIQTAGKTYEFFKITNVMWAVKNSPDQWLTASDAWSSWYDLDDSLLRDPYSEQIELAGDSKKPLEDRKQALEKLDSAWSPNVRDLCVTLLDRANEEASLQTLALQYLKRKPSRQTAGALIQFLEKSNDADLKRQAGQILKLQNPAGPKFDPSSNSAEQTKALEFWRNWWKQNSQKP